MAQVNVEFDDTTVTAIEHAAAKRGLRRPEYLRLVMKAALDAEADGRELFSTSATTVRPEAVGRLVAKLEAQTIELGRVLKDNARRDATLYKKASADDADHRTRLAAVEAQVSEHLRRAMDPFSHKVDALREAVMRHPELPRITASIATLGDSVRAPPPANKVYIEGIPMPSRWWHWLIAVARLVSFAFVIQLMVTRSLPDGVGVRIADRLLAGDDAFHKLAIYRYGHDICAMPATLPAPPVAGMAPGKTGQGGAAHRGAR